MDAPCVGAPRRPVSVSPAVQRGGKFWPRAALSERTGVFAGRIALPAASSALAAIR
jgi:hypothetical protein